MEGLRGSLVEQVRVANRVQQAEEIRDKALEVSLEQVDTGCRRRLWRQVTTRCTTRSTD